MLSLVFRIFNIPNTNLEAFGPAVVFGSVSPWACFRGDLDRVIRLALDCSLSSPTIRLESQSPPPSTVPASS